MKFRNRVKDLTVVLKFLLFPVLILLLSLAVLGQTSRTDIFYVVELSQPTKGQVVKRILAYYFRPSRKPKVIYLAEEHIEKDWLPSIKNIEFRLLSSDEIE